MIATARATTISITGEALPVAAPGGGLRRALTYGLAATVIFGVLALGGVPEWAQLAMRMAAIVLLLVWLALGWRTGSVAVQRNPAYVAGLAFALVVAVQLVFRASVYRYITWTEAAAACAYAIFFFIAAEVLTNRRLAMFQLAMATFGAALAFFAVLQYLSRTQQIYWLVRPQFGGMIFGPFTNHNHYAGAIEMLWPFALLLAVRATGARRAGWMAAAALMVASIFLSASRGGVISCVAQMAIAAIILVSGRRKISPAALLWSLIVLLLTGGAIFWLASPATLARLINTDGAQRTLIYRDALRMWLARPWLGFGLGTFPYAYPRYRSFYSVFFINQAHNDYLQLLVECGIAGFACMAAFLALVLRQGARAIQQLGFRDAGAATRLAAMLGIAGILVHSLLDFNLHIPANAALFAVLCGIAGRRS